ncbi:DUF3352 domain-containing protein [Maribellus sp. YY47]|uniref:DUF3352 domain-containing protein n=1 Tax=Maribellus sp. YY47 TaxID=2929486 RepID=UPI0020010D93|nr:DUF3352 domain-containing protein [Maribellus sp. YY47]MCK3682628.1 DUF3352 domain-containing protein [Maribellus sp. YY47]
MKKYLIIILLIVVGGLAAYFLWNKTESVFTKETSFFKAVPVSSPFFLELSSLRSLPVDNEILEGLSSMEDISWLTTTCEQIDTLIRNNREIQNSLGKRPFVMAFDFVGENKLQPLIIAQMKSSHELHSLELLLSGLLHTPVSSFTSKKYNGHKITQVSGSAGKGISFAALDGLVLISPEVILVEKGIRQLSAGNLLDNHDFVKVSKSVTTQTRIAWYVNQTRLPELCSHILSGKRISLNNEFGESFSASPQSAVRDLENFAQWSELDIALDKKSIKANGITIASDSLNNFLSVFAGQEPVTREAGKVLPENTAWYISFSFSDRKKFFEQLENYFKRSTDFYQREERIRKMERAMSVDFKTTFEGMIHNQAIGAVTSFSEGKPAGSLFIFNLNAKKAAQSAIDEMIGSYASRNKLEPEKLITNYTNAGGEKFRIYQFPFPSLPSVWMSKAFVLPQASFLAFYSDYAIFGSSEKTLQNCLDNLSSGTTLGDAPLYRSFAENMESRSNVEIYADINRSFEWNQTLFNDATKALFKSNEEALRKFDAFSWQIICEKELFFNSACLSFDSRPKASSRAAWQTNLGDAIEMKPQIVVNYNNKATQDVLVQDKGNQLHLVSENGTKIWSIPISGKIMGEIFQIDFFRNGKLQFLFNTREKLYLIDRNGNNVSGFPVAFASPATNGVNVFDYDNNRKYRYFVACENRKVLAYDQNGKMVSGWDFDKTASEVSTPVQHFRVAGKDYIVFKDRSKIYIQDRRGITRVKTAAAFESSDNPLYLNLDGTPKMVTTDKDGVVYYLYFDGRYVQKNTGKYSSKHRFNVSDLNGNGIPDFIFVDENKLEVIDENGKKLYSEKLDNTITEAPGVYTFSANQKMVGISDTKAEKIYLFKPDGKLYDGFPMRGSSAFSIGALTQGQLNVVVGSNSGKLYSYALK